MDKKQLLDILGKPFDDAAWQSVLQALFGSRLRLLAQPRPIDTGTHDQVRAAYELGSCTTADDRLIGFYKVEVKPNVWLERNKVGLRRLLRHVYKYDVDGALIVFVQQEKWRLSFVSEIKVLNEAGELVEQVTEPKRYTYLLGEGEKVRTPAEQLSRLMGKPLALQDLLKAFSVEALNEDFYKVIQQYFYRLVGGKVGKGKKAQDYGSGILQLPGLSKKENRQQYQEFAVRLIGRTIFCWFLKMKKSEAGLPLLPDSLLSSQAVKANPNYYHSVLERIFFQMLNTPMAQRPGHLPPEAALVPFLNGGLFEPGSDDYYKPNSLTGLSEYLNTLVIDDQWFEAFFTELEKYNFTIDENSVTDVEVSVDPEMLGRIFENLLAEINPETGESARNATGSFYTPREIVDYMATESLVHYLHTHTRLPQARLRALFKMTDIPAVAFTEDEKRALLDALDKVKILDPACGSGAFPMGMLQKIVQALRQLDPDAAWWIERQVNQNTHPAARRAVREKLQQNPDYARKIGIIQNSLYGVDIQPIAAEISKLRCFLTLIVDETIREDAPNRGIEPLPNLEFKFVTADALMKLPESGDLFHANDEDDLNALQRIRLEYLQSHGEQKKQLKEQFNSIQERIVRRHMEQLHNNVNVNSRAFQLSIWKPFSHEKAAWFDPQWMFGVSGFDIVIGNPPYVQIQKMDKAAKEALKRSGFRTFSSMGDLYALFYERGMELLKPQGILCYITSNKWMRAGYGEPLRDFFCRYNPLLLIDLGPGIFRSATVDTNILLIQKAASPQKKLRALSLQKQNGSLNIEQQLHEKAVLLEHLGSDTWFIGTPAELRLKEKIERKGKPLKEWDVNIYRGVLTGLNEAFIISTEKRNEILANCQDEEERKRTEAIIKPILRGRDIKRYYYDWAGLWVIGTFPALHLNIDDYPALKKYFLDHFDIRQLEQSGKKYPELGFNARKKTSNKWFETQDTIAYYQEFEKEKVVYSETIKIYFDGSKNYPRFSFTTKEFYLDKTTFFMSGNNQKYFLGILNSNVNKYLLENGYCVKLGSGSRGLQKILIEQIPIPPITPSNQHIVAQIEQLVDKILAAKQENKNADTTQWEREIDSLVYSLYELTEEEIRIIENQQ